MKTKEAKPAKPVKAKPMTCRQAWAWLATGRPHADACPVRRLGEITTGWSNHET